MSFKRYIPNSTRQMVRILYKMDASPPARSAHMMLDLLGLEAEYVEIDIIKGVQFGSEYRKINPIHTVPTLVDDGFIVFESNAIAAYLVDKYAKDDSLYPKDLQKRAIINQRLHFNAGILFPTFRGTTAEVIFKHVGKVTDERKGVTFGAYGLLEALLAISSGPWLAGDQVTIADICSMSTVYSLNNILPINGDKFPKSRAWLKKCSELPTFQKINVPGNEILRNLYTERMI